MNTHLTGGFAVWLLHTSFTAHSGGHFFDPFQRERRLAQGLHGHTHELHGIVVRRYPVGAERAAPTAAVDNRPLAALTHPNRNGFHDSAAFRRPVARLYIHVQAAQAIGAMVPVVAACILGYAKSSADLAGKAVTASVRFIVTFFKSFSFIFPIHVLSS